MGYNGIRIVRGVEKEKQEWEGMVSLFSLEARALLVAISLGFAMSQKLGPF